MADDQDDQGAADDRAADDAAFRRGVKARDPAAWKRLMALYDPTLRRQASWLLSTRMDPENAVAEVWYRAFVSVHRYDAERSPLPWLARICVHTCLNARRGPRARRTEPLDASVAAPARAPEEDSDARREACRDALASLPERDREIVTLRYLFELPPQEIAVLLGVAIDTVGKALLRGIERLKSGAAAVGLVEWSEIGSLEGMGRLTP